MANIGSIDTDAALGTILSNFSSDYILHVVSDSLEMKFRPFQDEMNNMVDILERQFISVYYNAPDYTSKVIETRNNTFEEIIRIICNYYNLSLSLDFDNISNEELYGIARTMYDIFISRFTSFMIDFFVRYIINNSNDLYNSLMSNPNANKPKESGIYSSKNYIDPKFILIHANINSIILNMTSYDISLNELLSYFCDSVTASRLSNILADNGDIYKNYYASYISNPITSAEMITSIKLALQSKTQETYQV